MAGGQGAFNRGRGSTPSGVEQGSVLLEEENQIIRSATMARRRVLWVRWPEDEALSHGKGVLTVIHQLFIFALVRAMTIMEWLRSWLVCGPG